MKIRPIVQKYSDRIDAFEPVVSIAERLVERSCLVVEQGGRFKGLLSSNDIVLAPHTIVLDCLQKKPAVRADEEMSNVLKIMKESRQNALPVYENDTFLGIVLQEDIVDYLQQHRSELEHQIARYTMDLTDTNERLKREIAQRCESEQRFRDLSELLPLPVFETDIEGVVRFANKAALLLFSITEEEITKGLNLLSALTPEELQPEKNIGRLLQGERLSSNEYTITKKDGSHIPVQVQSAPIMYEGTITGLRCVVVDMTEIKTTRTLLQEEQIRSKKGEALSFFAGGIAHDFNNILSAVMGNASLAEYETPQGSKVAQLLKETNNALRQAAALVHQLQIFLKSDSLINEIVGLDGILRENGIFLLRGSSIKLHFDIQKDLWCVKIDPGKIGQVINNLIINASEAMPEGGVLKISAENVVIEKSNPFQLVKGRYVKLAFHDNGVGIPQEHLEKIFDPYYTTKKHGSGLGLSICHSIIEKHSGHISVDSKKGSGTTFTFYLPAQKEASINQEPSQKDISTGDGRVLVMDDEEMIRTMLRSILLKLGYEPVCVSNHKETIEEFKKALNAGNPYKFIILDATIPGGKGAEEILLELRKLDHQVKAIISSGYSFQTSANYLMEKGFSGILPKPYTIQELAVCLKSIQPAVSHR